MEVKTMSKTTFAIKIDEKVIQNFKTFCDNHGIKYSFFVEEAIRRKLKEEEIKEDLLDLKSLCNEENEAVPFEEYLRARGV